MGTKKAEREVDKLQANSRVFADRNYRYRIWGVGRERELRNGILHLYLFVILLMSTWLLIPLCLYIT